MTSLWNWVRLKLTNDTNNTRLNNIKASFVEKARTYINEKLNCSSTSDNWAINTMGTKTSNKKAPKIKSLTLTWWTTWSFVELKINGSPNNIEMVNYYETLNVSIKMGNNIESCVPYWQNIRLYTPTLTKKYWTNLWPFYPNSTSINNIKLVAAHKIGWWTSYSSYSIGIYCSLINWWWTVSDTINIWIKPFKYWDANLDGTVNSFDAQVVLQHVNNSVPLTTRSKKCNADVDLNWKINSTDATLIGQYFTNMISNLPHFWANEGNWDTNQDGYVNSADAQIIASCMWNISKEWFQAGNVNWDSKLDYKDACIILNYTNFQANWVTSLPYWWPLPNNCLNYAPSSCTKMKTAECEELDNYHPQPFTITWTGS
jgi:hypothetical protein